MRLRNIGMGWAFVIDLAWRPDRTDARNRRKRGAIHICNLYSVATNQEARRALFRVINHYVGNLARTAGRVSGHPAPMIRNSDAGREMGFDAVGYAATSSHGRRNTSSPHRRGWLKPENRCLIPANSFAEYAPEPNPETKKKDVVWFAVNDDRPLFAFGDIWTEFKGDRGTKSKPIRGVHLVYGFVTTEANAGIAPIHPKAMPVI